MNKLCIASTIALCLAGTANAQVRPGEPIAGQAPTYAVDGLALGSKVKFESAAYRDYKCSERAIRWIYVVSKVASRQRAARFLRSDIFDPSREGRNRRVCQPASTAGILRCR
jgi:hypothetical protein